MAAFDEARQYDVRITAQTDDGVSQPAIRRLGRHWTRLHRLIYPIAVLAILHYWWMKAGKNDLEQPLIWGAVVALLLGLRIWWSRTRAAAPSRSVRS